MMNSLDQMRSSVFLEGEGAPAKMSRFWILLALSSVIAAAGVVADSAATVIGAMIVAPLMTPILGLVLATVVGDKTNLTRSWTLVIGGAMSAVALGYVVGLLVAAPVVAETNSQVAARVSPLLIDLLAALATGAVGAIAMVRRDISDTLPGVAIAIALVPPLAVVGLTLESGATREALGALLLFATNVAAILITGVVVLLAYRVGTADFAAAVATRALPKRRRAIVTTVITIAVIAVPLTASSIGLTTSELLENDVREAAQPWAQEQQLTIEGIQVDGDQVRLLISGEPPQPSTADLATALREVRVDPAQVNVEFIPAYQLEIEDSR